MNKHKIGRAILSGVSFLALAIPASAQSAPGGNVDAAATTDTTDIIVSGRRREESVQDVPLTVSGG